MRERMERLLAELRPFLAALVVIAVICVALLRAKGF